MVRQRKMWQRKNAARTSSRDNGNSKGNQIRNVSEESSGTDQGRGASDIVH